MKKMFVLALLASASLLFCDAAQAAVSQTIVIDVTKALPTSLDVHTGDRVVFVRPAKSVGETYKVTFDIAPAPRGRTVSPLQVESKMPEVKPGVNLVPVASFKVVNAGKGDFLLMSKPNAPHARNSAEHIGFVVRIGRQVSADDVDGKTTLR